VMDPMQPQARRKLAELPGTGWYTGAVSWDDAQLSVVRYVSANESEVWTIDLATGARRQLLPAAGGARATHYAGPFSRDGRAMFIVSDRAGEFKELMRYDLATGEIRRVTAHVPWNVEDAQLSEDGRRLAVRMNVDGRDELRLFDAATLAELPVPALPPGSVTRMGFHPASHELAFAVANARGPGELHSLAPATGRVQRWTRAAVPEGIDPDRFPEQQLVRWESFDGRTISGWLALPPARFTGRRPVLVSIHGGPEGQAKAGFMYRQNHFVQDLGIAVIEPNVRGSEGYGKTFLALDNGMKREDAVKDIGALLDWIAADPRLDPTRVVVSGGSYGGYMSLAVAATYPERIAGAIDVVGISHFVTFLQNTESYRRDLRRVEYGDERDAAMRAYLDRISPLTNAQRITRPLLVAQGRNDPRVPYTEAEQIVAKVRANGTPVWYLRAENEGHGFARKENADYFFYATILFLRDTMKLP
jgi:dipeptidyl aminopeptidase/acylaminoacyl peptidase